MKLLLIDDHELFRAGVKLLLSDLAEQMEFREAADCASALALPEAERTDVVLLDFHLPGLHGLAAIEAVRARFEGALIVVLSAEDDPALIRNSIDAGAAGFIPKTSTHAVMMAALRLVVAGGIYLPANARFASQAERRPLSERCRALGNLTERQTDTLRLAIRGKANKVIAREMGVSEATVKAHLSAIYRTLGVGNRTEAVFAAADLGITLQ